MRSRCVLCLRTGKRRIASEQTACQKCKGVNGRSVDSHHLSDTLKIKESYKKLLACLNPSCRINGRGNRKLQRNQRQEAVLPRHRERAIRLAV